MLSQIFMCGGPHRKLRYSLDPKILVATSFGQEEYYTIDDNGAITKVAAPAKQLSLFNVDLSWLEAENFLFFFLTPSERTEVPRQVQRELKRGGVTVAIDVDGHTAHLFAILPYVDGNSSYLAYLPRKSDL